MNYLGIEREKFSELASQMNRLLANYHVYYQNLRNFHWNVEGEHFFDLHEHFEGLYDDARTKIDEIAERILTIRYRPDSKMADYLRKAQINEAGIVDNDAEMVETILDNHRILIRNIRKTIQLADEISDEGTIDMMGGFLADIEKSSWMLDAWRVKKLEAVS
jgi:starvation-inducible DNA-binding protein